MKILWISFALLLSLALGSCGPSKPPLAAPLPVSPTQGESAPMTPPLPTPDPADANMVFPITPDATSTIATGVTTTIAAPTVIEIGAWKTYHNTDTGYSADYPADWTVNESAGINGELITTFIAADDGQGIVVSTLNGEAAVEEIPDMPNTRCQQITISGLPGRRCLDTVASNISTAFIDQGKQYTIASSGKSPDQNIYQHFLESFTVTP